MIAYFRIKYMAPQEFTISEQTNFIRNYVEHICKLSHIGFTYDETIVTVIDDEPIVSIRYQLGDSINLDQLSSIMRDNEVLDELVIYITF